MFRQRPATRRGFTLVEAMISLSIMGIASGVLLLGTAGLLQTTDDGIDQYMAQGMAQQLMDEIAGMQYMEPGVDPYQTTLCPNATEMAAPGRSLYNDIDDYNGVRAQPPKSRQNAMLGRDDGTTSGSSRYTAFQLPSDYFSRWKQEVDVYYVKDNSLSTSSNVPTSYRAAQVRILYDDPQRGLRELAKLTRVFSYVPSN